MTYNISASQISTYSSCQRKWAWAKIAKIPAPQHASAALGTKMHSQLEKYLRGEPFDERTPEARMISEIARSGCQHLPAPKTPGMELEKHFAFELPSLPGVTFQGFIDLLLPGDVPLVIDHKSTSDFRYAKTPEDLRSDPQAVLYAYQAMMQFRAPTVDLKWVYYRTRGASASKVTHLRVLSTDVAQQIDILRSTSSEMLATYTAKPDVLTLPASTDACDAYGGCPYKMHCTDLHSGPLGHLTPEETKNMTQSATDLFARLQAANGAAPTAMPAFLAPATIPAPPPVQAPPIALPALASANQAPSVVAINPPESLLPPPSPVVEEPKAKKTRAKKETTETVTGYTLYIDCAPMNANGTIVISEQAVIVDSRITTVEALAELSSKATGVVRGLR